MTRNTRVKKFTVFYAGFRRSWLGTKTGEQLVAAPGMETALALISAVQLMCLTGEPFGIGIMDTHRLAPALHSICKFFVVGWAENKTLMQAIAGSSRVECSFTWCTERGIRVEFLFFEKARQAALQWDTVIDLTGGGVASSRYVAGQ